MGQNKPWAFHAEADSPSELATIMKDGLAKLAGQTGGGAGEAPAPTGKPAKAPKGGAVPAAKVTFDEVKNALLALKAAVGGKEDKDKKGVKAAKAVMKKFGVTASADLEEEQYADCLKAAQDAMPGKDEDKDAEEEDPNDV